jgi:cysteine desulfurase
MSVSAHKMGGPIGAGALVVRRGVTVAPVLHGGGQEGGIRSGTLAAPLIAAFGAAAEASGRDLDAGARRVAGLRDRLIEVVQAAAPDAILRGDPSPDGRLPGNAHFTFAGCEGDSLLYLLDARGIECSTGSACRAGVPEPSHVLLAMGVPEAETRGALRFSLGWSSTAEEVEVLGEVLPMVLDRARRAGVHA